LRSGNKDCGGDLRIIIGPSNLAEDNTIVSAREVVGTFAAREVIAETQTSSQGRSSGALGQVATNNIAVIIECDGRSVNGLAKISRTTSDSIYGAVWAGALACGSTGGILTSWFRLA